MAIHNQIGREGELAAKNYLESKGYIILELNWRNKRLEVDIIAHKGNILVFCEVKSRTSSLFGEPESFVDKRKQKNIIKSAGAYIGRKKWQGEARFDIIAVLFVKGQAQINHIKDAFGCEW